MSTTMTIRLDDDVKDRLDVLAGVTSAASPFSPLKRFELSSKQTSGRSARFRRLSRKPTQATLPATRTLLPWRRSGKRMRVRWLRIALRNLDEEASFIAADDAVAARLVVERVLGAVAQLAEQAGLGRPGRVPGTRELVVSKTRFIVPYRVRGDTVEILRVFHTSRRLPERW